MKKLGAYISPRADTASSSPYFTKGCFVYYEYASNYHGDIAPHINIWRLDAQITQNPDEVILLKSIDEFKKHIEQYDRLFNHYISYHDRLYRIRNITCRYARLADAEIIDELSVDAIDTHETWIHDSSSVYQFLKEAKLTDNIYKQSKFKIDYTRARPITAFPDTVSDMIKEDYKIMMNSYYGMGGFTTIPRLSPEEIGKLFDSKNKETKTMEKNKMTDTDRFLKDIDSITITSTYSKLDFGCGKPHYIYYPEMEITEDIADTLLTVLLMAKRDFIHKVVFNPEKGTTMLYRNYDKCTITVRCRDGEFDYILGYEMAKSKMYIGADDYNWFNKIKNHRKTHIEYTEKKPTKKGGKK
ncbi:MAG: hypothetical protein J6Y02_13690 [Pseudobutyrivibrio sp.]|nr:hypothetical protein [Pseudobutyrivibrio sp.]